MSIAESERRLATIFSKVSATSALAACYPTSSKAAHQLVLGIRTNYT